MEMKDYIYYVLIYLFHWDIYDLKISTAPLSETRRERYDKIMEKWQRKEIASSDVTGELASWFINFDSDSRKKFINWVAENKFRPSKKISEEEFQEKVQQIFKKVFGLEDVDDSVAISKLEDIIKFSKRLLSMAKVACEFEDFFMKLYCDTSDPAALICAKIAVDYYAKAVALIDQIYNIIKRHQATKLESEMPKED